MSFLVSGVGAELRRSLGRRGRAYDLEHLCPSFGTIVSNISASEVDILRLFSSSVTSSSSSSSSSKRRCHVDVDMRRRVYHDSSHRMMDGGEDHVQQRPKALLRGTLTQAESPLTAAEIWELVEPQGMKSKRFMKTMLKQMRERGEVKTKPSDGSNNSFVYYHVSTEER
ncbi:hypothetical protein M9435_006617 [Picochlorum sp. BPE23]|nr:hypothetical protein M9435_006617 [Picochlorum sp. BPE23]